MYTCSELHENRMREEDVDVLCIANACSCSADQAPSKNQQFIAGVEMLFSKTFHKGGNIGSY